MKIILIGRAAFVAASLAFSASAALAEVKEGDPGATCTNSTETIQGQQASCKSCSATKCDTSGTTVSNCRTETTKTCTIAGRVVDTGTKKGPKLDRVPDAVLDPGTNSSGGIKAPLKDLKLNKKVAP